jgi:small subunit ribosomal protein S25
VRTLGKTEEVLEEEAVKAEKQDNPANFGKDMDRWCMCSTPGQLPCPNIIPLPKHWRGKYHWGLASEEDDQ